VITWLAWTTGALSLALAALAGLATALAKRIDDVQLLLAALLELAMLAQAVTGVVLLTRTERDVPAAVFAGYLLTTVLVPPLGTFWAFGERSRWGTGVLAVAGLTCAILVVRLEQIWRTGA
jgi:hypothetical protein